jgi:hypothetical protein
VLSTPTIIMTASSPTLNIQQGQTATATLVFTLVNGWAGSIALSCGQLPLGMNCTFNPATITSNATPGSAGMLYGSVTVNTNSSAPVVGSLVKPDHSRILSAGMLLLPGTLLGGLLFFTRRRFFRASRYIRLMAVLFALLGGLALGGCGGSSSLSNLAPIGTQTVVLTATATGTPNTGSQNMTTSINLTVNVTR